MKETDKTDFRNNETKYDACLQNEMNRVSFRQKIEKYYDRLGCWATHLIIICSPFIFLYMCIKPPLQIFALAYLLWMYYDRETPHRGGRRLKWLRKMRFWRGRIEYFPIELVKTAELPPDTTYLFASFPHGLFVLGASTNFLNDVNHFDEKFPGLNVYVSSLNANFMVPFVREILLLFGVVGCSSRSILHTLNGPPGNVCVLTVGGMAEIMISRPGTNRIVLKNRKGFVKVALQAGSSLVPVFTFGETDAYDQPLGGRWYKWLQETRRSGQGGFAFFKGPCKLGHLFGILPYQRPITTVVGKPIKLPKEQNPSDELVDKYHKIFVQEMIQLFEKYKSKYDCRGEKAVLSIE